MELGVDAAYRFVVLGSLGCYRKVMTVPAHDQEFTHSYIVYFPAHEPRDDDPHHVDFETWKQKRRDSNTYYCDFAHDHRNGDTSECDLSTPLEGHHSKIEFALMNGVDFTLLAVDFPGINEKTVGAWIDSDANLMLLCANHHRGVGGIHNATYSDFSATYYIRNLIGSSNETAIRSYEDGETCP